MSSTSVSGTSLMDYATVKTLLEERVKEALHKFKEDGDTSGLIRKFGTDGFVFAYAVPTGQIHEFKREEALHWLDSTVKSQHAPTTEQQDTRVLDVSAKPEITPGCAKVWVSMTGRDYDYGGGMREGVIVYSWRRGCVDGEEVWSLFKLETLPATQPF